MYIVKLKILKFFIGTMPEDYELYYGFTRFAMELNELDLETAKVLPKTDTRFRPDQRYNFILWFIIKFNQNKYYIDCIHIIWII